MKIMKRFISASTIVLASLSLSYSQTYQAINYSLMDKSVRPQDDFYNFVNGNWMKSVEIPADKSRWGSFDELRENTDLNTLKLLKNLITQKHIKGSDGQKIADLYHSFIDMETRNKLGIKPIEARLQKIDNIKNIKDLEAYLIEVAPEGGNPFFGGYVYANMKNSNENAVYAEEAFLSLGRSYYQKEDEKNAQTLSQFSEFASTLFAKMGQKTRDLKGPKIVGLEKEIASYLLTIEEQRDAQKQYNPVALKDLNKMVKNIDLGKYFTTVGYHADTIIIGELNYFQNLDKIINEQNIPLLKDYLKFKLMNEAAGYLTQDLNDLAFDFYGKKLRGQKEQRDIEKRGLEFVNRSVGELLGKLYVAEYFPAEAKAACQELVDYLIKSFQIHIENLDWMSAATKVKAQDKLSKFTVKIGYPDQWKDFSKLEIGNSLYENYMQTKRWAIAENMSKIGKPVDKKEWGMSPQTVNAYYNPLYNEIVFPAAILQAPFYDFRADAAVNFGGIGAVIGHELSHGFDDAGCQYDGNGNLNNWWTEEDKAKFDKAADALVEQYNQYEPVKGVFVNGRFTLGENIGDLGGASVAFDALKLYLKDKGNPGEIDGFTPEQRFFMSWATIWRTKATEEFSINQVKTDPHTPAQFRAFAPIINMDGFHEAWKTKPGDNMFKPKNERIVIW